MSVNQVNFKGNDLQQLSSIHSFGNLVSYDSDLKNAGPASEPVSTQRVLAHTCKCCEHSEGVGSYL